MSGPPTNIGAADLFAKLIEMPRPVRVVDFPRYDADGNVIAQVAIRVLTQEEVFVCTAEAEQFARKSLKMNQGEVPKSDEAQRGYMDLYMNAAAVETLFRACRNVENHNVPFFPTKESVKKFTNDELGALMHLYIQAQAELGPIVAKMDKDEVDAWIKRLVEGGNAYPFVLLSLGAQTDLVMHMARRLYTSPTDTSSSGSLADESSMTSDNDSSKPSQ